MSMEHDIELKVNYTVNDCFEAALSAVSDLKNYEITEKNEVIGTIRIKAKGITSSPGDYVTITISHETAVITKVLIKGGVKIPYMLAKRNSIKNAEAVSAAFANKITAYKKAEQNSYKASSADTSIENKLEQLKSMYQKNLITLEDYEQKKGALLDSLL